ncbi:MAG: lysylphosphatidylglycerol synthase transmembrane domain-containing protein [Candidatus Krumholzibacteriota bacterium]|nr:lysylphosphatidylglycerol synthase transmembrane domain-containing protein [Candidatus Krumholzibacteriota bacterium]
MIFHGIAESLRSKKTRIIFQVLGIILFIYILIRVDLSAVLKSFTKIKPLEVGIILIILVTFTFIKGLRWKILLAGQGKSVSMLRSFSVYSAGLYLGVITPGRVGDFIKSLYLINRGFSFGKALFSSLVDRIFDLIFLVLIGYISFMFFPGIFKNQILVSTLILIFTIIAVLVFFWRRDILFRIAKNFTSLILPSTLGSKMDQIISEVLDEFETLSLSSIIGIILLTFGAWALHYLTFIVFANILSIEMSVSVLIVTVSAAIFTALIPVSISGLGTRELVLIFIFNRIGLTREAAVAFSFSFIIVYIIQSTIGMICWLTGPFHSRDLLSITHAKDNLPKY